jgi:putative transposase
MQIHERYTYRMHDLSEFMKSLMQRFTRWHNRMTKRRGNLWEETFKSVVVEDGIASRDDGGLHRLEPGAGRDGGGSGGIPVEFSYGEAVGGGGKGDGKKARAGLVRAIMADKGTKRTRGTGRARFRGNTGCCCYRRAWRKPGCGERRRRFGNEGGEEGSEDREGGCGD